MEISKMKQAWQKKEKKDQKSFGAKPTPRSGGFWNHPGDQKNDKFLIDSKDTIKESFSIKKLMWQKIWREAIKSQRLPMLSINLAGVDLVVLDKNDFITLMEENDKLEAK